ncbi:hypothetical protein [Ornithinimicrobium kibberense]
MCPDPRTRDLRRRRCRPGGLDATPVPGPQAGARTTTPAPRHAVASR